MKFRIEIDSRLAMIDITKTLRIVQIPKDRVGRHAAGTLVK